jgi:sugar lactone lactonase YvrE
MAGPDAPDVVIALSGVSVTTLAGSEVAGTQDGAGAAAHFNNPTSVLRNANGSLVVSDFDNGRIRSVTAGGMVQTLTQATGFARPFALALGPSAELYVGTDYDETGVNAGVAGGVLWRLNGGQEPPTALALQAGRPRGIVAIGDSGLAVTDIEGQDLRYFHIESQTFSTFAGKRGCPGFADGPSEEARFNRPYGLVKLPNGDLIIADQRNHRLRRVSSEGEVTTFAGDGAAGLIDGPVAESRFNLPQALALDADGNLYVSDVGNHRIRRISAQGIVETVAGDGEVGFKNGDGKSARFSGQEGIAVSEGVLYLADGTSGEVAPFHRVRKITLP